MLYMAVFFNDPLVQLGLFICAYIIVTGVCSYFGYSSDQYGIYIAFTAFMISVIMILPDPIKLVNTFNTIVAPFAVIDANNTVNPMSASAVSGVGVASTAATNLATGIAKVFTDLMNRLPSFHTTVRRSSNQAAPQENIEMPNIINQ